MIQFYKDSNEYNDTALEAVKQKIRRKRASFYGTNLMNEVKKMANCTIKES